MTSPVAELRARPGVVRLGADGAATLAIRVEVPAVWDVVRIEAPATTSVREIKERALDALVPDETSADAWVVKLHGFEALDESESLVDAGARNGSTFVLLRRRRTPVK